MKVYAHKLEGCSPTPLASYLKAVGVLRLICEQRDANVRGYWKGEVFCLVTKLSRDELTRFFLHEYQPTPLVAPWNGGSGFYPKDKKTGIDALKKSRTERFERYRVALKAAQEIVGDRDKSPKNEEKCELIAECRRRWRGPLLDWLNAALVLAEDGSPAYPALLGTGGNDGRLDFTNNYMQRLVEIFDCETLGNGPRPGMDGLLEAALFGEPHSGLASVAIGQFDPGGAGGANSSTGYSGNSLVNHWDFVLMLEGAVAFASGVVRRVSTQPLPQAAAPFAVFSSPSGYASGVEGEKSRGEQWMPLWDHPLTFGELKSLVAEGRCQLGDQPVRRPLDMARAIARLGIARGVSAFERYGYIERNGQANLATPLGRWKVPQSPVPFQELLTEVEGWVDRLRQKANSKGAPRSIGRAVRRCENAMMLCCRDGHDSGRWRHLLVCLGEAEFALIRSPGFTAEQNLQPLGSLRRLSHKWLIAAAADSIELRLALALAGGHGIRRTGQGPFANYTWNASDPIRRHFMPLELPAGGKESQRAPRRFASREGRLASDPSVVCRCGDLLRDAVALMYRRIIETHRALDDFLSLAPVPGTEASLSDLLAFASAQVNEVELLALARPLMALDWSDVMQHRNYVREELVFPQAAEERAAADALAVFGLLRLCHYWKPVPIPIGSSVVAAEEQPRRDTPITRRVIERDVRLSPSIYSQLGRGDLAAAVRLSARRLKSSGLRPHLTHGVGDSAFARRLAASLAFPIGDYGARLLAQRLIRPHLDLTEYASELVESKA